MKNEIKKSNLVPIFEQGFESLKFSKKWKESLSKGIHRLVGYMEVNHLEVYSESIGKDFVTQQCRQPSYLQRINGRVIFLLDSFIEGKKYTLLPPRVTYVFPGNIGACSQRFIREEEVSKRLSYQTVRTYTATLSHFSIAMDIRQVALQNLKRHDIEAFMSSVQNMGAHIFIPLRKFLRYLHDTGITEQDFSQLLQNLKSRRGSKLPSVYTPEEIIQLERNIQRGSSIGKRNYAMLLLASRLGLRASDIVNLEFSNMDWDNKTIRLYQLKTGRPIELPLLSDVGDAITRQVRYKADCEPLTIIWLKSSTSIRIL